MENEIIYTCNSINSKNIRKGELEILIKKEDELCFEFGSSVDEMKRRCYNDVETLNKDFNELVKLKGKKDKKVEGNKLSENIFKK